MPTEFAVSHAQWEVMWVKVKGGEKSIVAIDFEDDFVGAQHLYLKVHDAEKPLATLRCKNIAFRPPEKYADKMAAYNRKGVWWCPYCMQLRRFERRAYMEIDGHLVSSDPAYYCPMCDISHRNGHVAKYNPLAQRLLNARKSRGGKRRKRGRQRK